MSSLNSREKKIFFLCVTLIGVFGLNKVIFKPLQNRITILDQKIKKGEKRLRKDLRVSRYYASTLKEYKEYLAVFQQNMSDEQEMSSIIAQLESMTHQNQLQFSEMKPQKVTEINFYKVFPVSLKMDGELDQINQFLYKLQTSPYFFRVDKLRLEKKTRQKSVLKATLVLSKLLIQEN